MGGMPSEPNHDLLKTVSTFPHRLPNVSHSGHARLGSEGILPRLAIYFECEKISMCYVRIYYTCIVPRGTAACTSVWV